MDVRVNHYADDYLDMSNLSTDCWDSGEIVAVCAVDHKARQAIAFQTKSYCGQLEKYYATLKYLGFPVAEIRLVAKEDIFQIRVNTFANGEPRLFEEG